MALDSLGVYRLVGRGELRLRDVYYDTPDGELVRRRAAVRRRNAAGPALRGSSLPLRSPGCRRIDDSGYSVLQLRIVNAIPETRYLEFVYIDLFERTRKGVLTDEEVRAVEDELLERPTRGDVMEGTGGVRKIRAAQEGHGKSGSARVAYLYVEKWASVFFMLAFPKNVQGNLTSEQKKIVRDEVARIRAEEWPRRKRKR
ncbi:MAG TPA: type II toxin-antitoxin system RelE/ParE family toxin [Longimicrobiaceae bacterium]|nr:type II toxin-antitoxin system RelE/ParE family toxin [Longimicrobiaceae bacterium]